MLCRIVRSGSLYCKIQSPNYADAPILGYAAATELSRPPSFPQNDMQLRRRRLLIRSVGGGEN